MIKILFVLITLFLCTFQRPTCCINCLGTTTLESDPLDLDYYVTTLKAMGGSPVVTQPAPATTVLPCYERKICTYMCPSQVKIYFDVDNSIYTDQYDQTCLASKAATVAGIIGSSMNNIGEIIQTYLEKLYGGGKAEALELLELPQMTPVTAAISEQQTFLIKMNQFNADRTAITNFMEGIQRLCSQQESGTNPNTKLQQLMALNPTATSGENSLINQLVATGNTAIVTNMFTQIVNILQEDCPCTGFIPSTTSLTTVITSACSSSNADY